MCVGLGVDKLIDNEQNMRDRHKGHSIDKENFFEKGKLHFFPESFYHWRKLCIVWNCFIEKYILILFVSRLFRMAANQTECFKLEQRSVIKSLVAEKCKPCEIYRRICNVYREASSYQKIYTNWLNMGSPQQTRVEKTVAGMEIHWFSSKEKLPAATFSKKSHANNGLGHERMQVPGAVVSKEGHADSVLGHERMQVPGAVVSKEGHADSVLGHERMQVPGAVVSKEGHADSVLGHERMQVPGAVVSKEGHADSVLGHERMQVPGAVVSKEGYADSILGHERMPHKWFSWKRGNCKQCFLMLTPSAKFSLFTE